jgi:hypothetical protein
MQPFAEAIADRIVPQNRRKSRIGLPVILAASHKG